MITSSSTTIAKKLFLFFLIITGLYYGKVFLMPFVIGGILATLFLPFCNWMEKKKIPKGIAVFLCFFTLFLFLSGLVALLSWKISEVINDITLLKDKASDTVVFIQKYIYSHFNISIEEQYKILKEEKPSYSNMVQMLLSSLAVTLTNLILVTAYFLFLLYYRSHIKQFILKLTAISEQQAMEQIIHKVANVSQQYLIGLSKMIVCLWIMYYIGFSFIGLENALFFAILCGFLEIIPFVGNITGTALTILIAAMHGGNLILIGGIAITYGVVQFIQGWLLEPLMLGPQVKINPLFTIIALVLGELLWGIPGIILAIPLTAMLKIICDHVETLKPYGFLIGEIESKKSTNSSFFKKIKALV
ncbi:AI-2E family transporter [Flavobacterium aquariorum]|uniref:AI-2E family transporter n=1 Tax=Flavobacterium aquariorum TaxID=2217670 RepID=A0A2W7TRY2_9FLAO|nr:AI-2E family transporter [Flavobacterium aquariorum]PZX92066.1 AI-2E family transporter [Flavobacterium aquariorum]